MTLWARIRSDRRTLDKVAALGGLGLIGLFVALRPSTEPPPTAVVARFTAEDTALAAMACALALAQAERLKIGPGDARLVVPWQIGDTGVPNQVSCAIQSAQGTGAVAATRVCKDDIKACVQIDGMSLGDRVIY